MPLSLIIRENVYQNIITGKRFEQCNHVSKLYYMDMMVIMYSIKTLFQFIQCV